MAPKSDTAGDPTIDGGDPSAEQDASATVLQPAADPQPEAPAGPAPEPQPDAPAVAEQPPAPMAAVVVANGKLPAGALPLLVIMAESRKDDGSDDTITYDPGAQMYLRMTQSLDMGCPLGALKTVGVDVSQWAFAGFSPTPFAVNVGPAHPAYAAVNLAYNYGAKQIQVVGLSDHWKQVLQPYFDEVNGNADYGVVVSVA